MIPQDLHPSITANIDESDESDDLPITSNPDPSATTSNDGREESNVRDVTDASKDEQITEITTNMAIPPVPAVQHSERVPKLSAVGAAMQGIPHRSTIDQVHAEIQASNTCQHEGHLHEESSETAMEHMLVSDDDPTDYADAMSCSDAPEWRASVAEEMKSISDHEVWTLIPPQQVPAGCKVVPSKLILQYKLDEQGHITWQKVHLVAKGFHQHPGLDYTDTFAPVA